MFKAINMRENQMWGEGQPIIITFKERRSLWLLLLLSFNFPTAFPQNTIAIFKFQMLFKM
jgi:hypothetical protein